VLMTTIAFSLYLIVRWLQNGAVFHF
jgi:hypothetical protein